MNRLENLQIFFSFKIKKCHLDVCDNKFCCNYHDDSDKRRFPLKITNNIKDKNWKFLTKFKEDWNYTISDFF